MLLLPYNCPLLSSPNTCHFTQSFARHVLECLMLMVLWTGSVGPRRRSSAGGVAEAAALLDEVNAWAAGQTSAPGPSLT